MAATIATMATLNAKCIKATPNSKPTTQTKSTSLLSMIPKGLGVSSGSRLTVERSTASVATGALFAILTSSEPALAAQQIAQLAEGSGDNRGLALLLPLVPAIGWVLFNILQPALNQINRMRSEKAVVLGLGLGGLTWAANPTPAEAGELASLAAAAAGDDSRGTLLLIVVLPAIGWVLFNILQPALNQLNRMRSE